MAASVTQEQWSAVQESLRTTAGRFCELVTSVPDPGARATVKWSVADVIAHLAAIAWIDTTLLRVAADPFPMPGLAAALEATTVDDVHGLNDQVLSYFAGRDAGQNLALLRDHVDLLLTASRSGDPGQSFAWLAGARLPLAGVLAHLVNELLLHGDDIARAVKVPWAIPPEDAAFFFDLFFLGLARGQTGRLFESSKHPPERRIAVEFRSGYTTPAIVVACRGRVAVEPPGSGADATVRFDPAALNMMLFGRISKARAVLTRKIVIGGRRPWLLPAFLRTVRAPS